MSRTLLTVAVIGLAMLTASEAFAAGRGCRRGGYVQAPVATAQAGTGYRTYSYEPGMASAGTRTRSRAAKAPYLDATSKALGKSYK